MTISKASLSTRGLLATQFFSLLNDHTLKQLVLLTLLDRSNVLPVIGGDLQGVAIAVFAAPFLILAGPAGRTADRFRWRSVIVWAKYVEIAIMLLVGVAYFASTTVPLWALFGLLIAMAAQSAFLTPAKYGIILDLVGQDRVSSTNGAMQMLGYVAIVCGAVCGGLLVTWHDTIPWLIGSCLTIVAVLGVITAHCIPNVRGDIEPIDQVATSGLNFATLWKAIADLRLLRDAMVVYGFLWLIAGLYHPIINAFCRGHLQLSPATTSLVLAASVMGIATGCVIAGKMERRMPMLLCLRPIAVAVVVCQCVLAILIAMEFTMSVPAIASTLFVLGLLTGAMILPIHVLIQVQTPAAIRGQVMAAQAVVNWTAILLSGIVYQLIRMVMQWRQADASSMFFALAAITMVGVWFLRPNESRLLARKR